MPSLNSLTQIALVMNETVGFFMREVQKYVGLKNRRVMCVGRIRGDIYKR